jgi:hypothetical protein
VALAIVFGGILTHRERRENIVPCRVKQELRGGLKILADMLGTEISCPFPAILFRALYGKVREGELHAHQARPGSIPIAG